MKERVTAVAALKNIFPAWLAVIVQVPQVSKVTLLSATRHTDGVFDVKATDKPDVLVAAIANVESPHSLLARIGKLMVWATGTGKVMVNDRVTWGAAA